MSLALYRRYRPETFAEVIGQEHVTDPLQQALRNNRVNHAYLFSGPRGCGKTTSARILARCLNCEQGPTPTPCGECQSCLDLARNGPGSIDVIEIDAASHGGVDDARDLREKAFFGPAGSRYKIYIIDEAHMVTSAGFNALLKVVEEPPEHLKFIFATTEPEKVIGTIRSRTHHYPFRLVPPGTLRDHLAEVCVREAIPVEDGVYPLVVRAGAGSVRDSMSVMDQLLAGADAGGVTYAMATALLGYTDAALLDDVVDGFAAGDGAAVFEIVDRVVEGGHDPRRFVADLLERLRDLVILAAVPDAVDKGLIDAPRDVLERMQAQASVLGAAELSRAADLVNTGLTEMRGATSPRLQLELICARVLLPAAYEDERSLQARLERLERGIASGAIAVTAPAAVPSGSHAADLTGGSQTGAPGGPGGAAAARAAMGRTPPEPAGRAPAAPPHAAPPAAQPPAAQPPAVQPPAAAAPYEPAPAAAEPPAARPGAWPTTAGTTAGATGGTGQPPAPRPGAWPTTAGQDRTPAPAQQQHAQQNPRQQQSPPAVPSAPGGGTGPGAAPLGDPSRVRQMWPNILEAVKNRRRLTWMLLSNNAQVSGFDGETLQIGFDNPGARNSFANNGSEDVLKQAINDALGVQWKIEAIVDPSGGGQSGGQGPGPSGGYGGGGFGSGGGSSRPPQGGPGPGAAPAPTGGQPGGAAPSPYGSTAGGPAQQGGPGGIPGGQGGGGAAPAMSSASASSPGSGSGSSSSSAAATARAQAAAGRAAAPPAQRGEPYGGMPPAMEEPPPLEDDIPEDDDPELVDSAPSGHDMFIRELGATVIEEINHG
ncbi:DNA polymerase III subunit gamma and tau [Streptomyces sp. V4-01]|uniref:DNA-directed DNA polymerase n=1 Tax=Actinacidiphila polyblastidii TaxID=3110430 RepID=A0ABU7PFQ9_9ACTN|nr:DNA polymerase III subunit gamma and tau [Streptomyces sp. V4-01]